MDRLFWGIKKILYWSIICLIGVNLVSVVLGVLTRFVINKSLGWTDELASYCLVWITFLGASVAVIDDGHLGFMGFVKKFRPKVQELIGVFNDLVLIFCIGILGMTGYQVSLMIWADTASSMPLSKGFLMMVIPVNAVIMVLFILWRLIRKIISFVKKRGA